MDIHFPWVWGRWVCLNSNVSSVYTNWCVRIKHNSLSLSFSLLDSWYKDIFLVNHTLIIYRFNHFKLPYIMPSYKYFKQIKILSRVEYPINFFWSDHLIVDKEPHFRSFFWWSHTHPDCLFSLLEFLYVIPIRLKG